MATTETKAVSKALYDTLISPNESDSNLEAANVVDGLFAIARAIRRLAEAAEKRDQPGGADDRSTSD